MSSVKVGLMAEVKNVMMGVMMTATATMAAMWDLQ
jgi:hypothetical protein